MTSIALSSKWCPEGESEISSCGASLRLGQVIDRGLMPHALPPSA